MLCVFVVLIVTVVDVPAILGNGVAVGCVPPVGRVVARCGCACFGEDITPAYGCAVGQGTGYCVSRCFRGGLPTLCGCGIDSGCRFGLSACGTLGFFFGFACCGCLLLGLGLVVVGYNECFLQLAQAVGGGFLLGLQGIVLRLEVRYVGVLRYFLLDKFLYLCLGFVPLCLQIGGCGGCTSHILDSGCTQLVGRHFVNIGGRDLRIRIICRTFVGRRISSVLRSSRVIPLARKGISSVCRIVDGTAFLLECG